MDSSGKTWYTESGEGITMKKQIALLLPVLHGIFYSRGITIITANMMQNLRRYCKK